jgi:hypothetical protein
MIGLLLAGLLFTQTPAAPPTPPSETKAAQAVPVLGELHAAQVDAHLSKLRALQAEVQLQQMALSQQREKINAVIALHYPGFKVDWDGGGALVPVPPASKKETP